MRTGLVAKKIGMTRIFDENNAHVPVTVLQMDGCTVTTVNTEEKNGYDSVQIGFGAAKDKHTSKPLAGHFKKNNVEAFRKLVEFRVSKDCMLNVGDKLNADHFTIGQYVDVQGTSNGKGFAGAMKRWNFAGMEATHGVSVSHRAHGSTGQCQDPGRTWKGKKMAGQYGNKFVSVLNLKIVAVDNENGLIMVKGAVPGAKQSFVVIKDAVKKDQKSSLVMPASLKNGNKQAETSHEEVQA